MSTFLEGGDAPIGLSASLAGVLPSFPAGGHLINHFFSSGGVSTTSNNSTPSKPPRTPAEVLDTSPLFIPRFVPLHLTPAGHPLRRLSLLCPDAQMSFRLWFPMCPTRLIMNSAGDAASPSAPSSPGVQQRQAAADALHEQLLATLRADFAYIFAPDIRRIVMSAASVAASSSEPLGLRERERAVCASLLDTRLATLVVPSLRHWFLAARFVHDWPTFLHILSIRGVRDAKKATKQLVKQGRQLGQATGAADDADAVVRALEQFGGTAVPPRSAVRLDDRWHNADHRIRVLRFGMWCSFIAHGVFRSFLAAPPPPPPHADASDSDTSGRSPTAPTPQLPPPNPATFASSGSGAGTNNNNESNSPNSVPSTPMLSQAASLAEAFVPLHVQLLLETGEHELALRTRVEDEMADEAEWGSVYGPLLMETRDIIRRFMQAVAPATAAEQVVVAAAADPVTAPPAAAQSAASDNKNGKEESGGSSPGMMSASTSTSMMGNPEATATTHSLLTAVSSDHSRGLGGDATSVAAATTADSASKAQSKPPLPPLAPRSLEQPQQPLEPTLNIVVMRARPWVSLPIVFLPKRGEIERTLLPPSRDILRRIGPQIFAASGERTNGSSSSIEADAQGHQQSLDRDLIVSPLRLLAFLYEAHLVPLSRLRALLVECYADSQGSGAASQAAALLATAGKRLVVLGSDPLLTDGGALERVGYAEVRKSETAAGATGSGGSSQQQQHQQQQQSSAWSSAALLGLRRSDYQSGNVLGRLLEEVRQDLSEQQQQPVSQSSGAFPAAPAVAVEAAAAPAHAPSGKHRHHRHHKRAASTAAALTVAAPPPPAQPAPTDADTSECNEATLRAAAAAAAAASASALRGAAASSRPLSDALKDLLSTAPDGGAPLRDNFFEFRVQSFALLVRPLRHWWTQHLAHYCGVKAQTAAAQIALLARSVCAETSNSSIALLSSLLQSGRGPIMCAVVCQVPAPLLEDCSEQQLKLFLDESKLKWCSCIEMAPVAAPPSSTEVTDSAVDDPASVSKTVPDSISDYFNVPQPARASGASRGGSSAASSPAADGDKPGRTGSKNGSGSSTPLLQPAPSGRPTALTPPTPQLPSSSLDATEGGKKQRAAALLFHVRFDAFERVSMEQMVVDARTLLLEAFCPSAAAAAAAATPGNGNDHHRRQLQQILASTLAVGARMRVFFGAQNFASRLLDRLRLARVQENALVCALMAAPRREQPPLPASPAGAFSAAPAAAAAAVTEKRPVASPTTTTTTTTSTSTSSKESKPAQRHNTAQQLNSAKMSHILSFLYLGSANDAGSATLVREGVTHVLNASHVRVFSPCSTLYTTFLGIPDVGDRTLFDIKSIFPIAFALIDSVQRQHDEWQAAYDRGGIAAAQQQLQQLENESTSAASATAAAAGAAPAPPNSLQWRRTGGVAAAAAAGASAHDAAAADEYLQPPKLLIHCEKGKSRSAAVVTAYLMRANGWLLSEALHYIRQRRPIVEPNLGFLEALKEYERELGRERTARRAALCVLLRNPAQSLSKQQLTRALGCIAGEQVVDCSDRIAPDGHRRVVVQLASSGGAFRALAACSRLESRMMCLGGRVWLTDFEEAVLAFKQG